MIYKEYFDLTEENRKKYGQTALVLMQVGSFYEMYGLKSQTSCSIVTEVSPIVAATSECMLKIAEKKEKYEYRGEEYTVVMAGFGECSLDKYLPILVEAGFSCAVYIQEDDIAKRGAKKRVFHGVYSSGTFFPASAEPQQQNRTNHLMTIWVHRYRPLSASAAAASAEKYMCALSVTSVQTGQSYLYEYTTPVLRNLSPTSFDELERAVSSFQPSEVIFVHQAPTKEEAQTILQFIGVNPATHLLHCYAEDDEIIKRCQKPAYIHAILKRNYGQDCRNVIQEFDQYEWATQCFCLMVDFLQQHSAQLVDRISPPLFSNTSKRLILGNHTLKQLNVLPSGGDTNKLSSLASFLNCALTPMGRRGFQHQILNPVFDVAWLNAEYAAIQQVLDQNQKIDLIRRHIDGIRDLEKILRQISYGNAQPIALWYLYDGLRKMQQLMFEHPWLDSCNIVTEGIAQIAQIAQIAGCCEELDRLMVWSLIVVGRSGSDDGTNECRCYIKPGIDAGLDKLQEDCVGMKQQLDAFRSALNEMAGDDHVKWHETAKSGRSLQITATRGKALMAKLKAMKTPIQIGADMAIGADEIRMVAATGSGEVVQCGKINALLQNLQVTETRFERKLQDVYRVVVLQHLSEKWYDRFLAAIKAIEQVDILQSKAYVAWKYGYCRPNILEKEVDASSKASYVKATKLRHPLIEQLQKNEIYVPNDASFDKGARGLLLYGTNAVGKTSYIKSVGVAIIMAQAGMYVAAESFDYWPYEAIYSRILGNDDLFKGLSTFVVEMSELRTILMQATPQTLVIGDEVCSGTETESALSIFTSALLHLYRVGAQFLFATHFHEVAKYEEVTIRMADAVVVKHMSVIFDASRDCLVYDRKLRDGPGPAIYGLEVAKSLYMPTEFLDEAFQIREKYFPETRSLLAMEPSRYNASKIRQPLCEICNREVGKEVHHLQPQEWADSRGLIGGSFHKNHPANLVTVCERCHDLIHHANK